MNFKFNIHPSVYYLSPDATLKKPDLTVETTFWASSPALALQNININHIYIGQGERITFNIFLLNCITSFPRPPPPTVEQ